MDIYYKKYGYFVGKPPFTKNGNSQTSLTTVSLLRHHKGWALGRHTKTHPTDVECVDVVFVRLGNEISYTYDEFNDKKQN